MVSDRSRRWRFTWEAQSHIPTLRLLILDSYTNPSIQCRELQVKLHLSQSLLVLTWVQDVQVSLKVPIPRVLVDAESPLSFRALDDHIEVKLVLLLPLDHPIVSGDDSLLYLSQDLENVLPRVSKPLVMDSDIKNLSSRGGVDFYCRRCAFKLTRSPLSSFVEMPSINWREVADNWFGACCCSFGGISEELVTRYANSYTCATGKCLLSPTSITICIDDIVECDLPKWNGNRECDSKPDMIGDDGSIPFNQSRTAPIMTCNDPCRNMLAFNEISRFAHSENKSNAANFDSEVVKEDSDDHLTHASPNPGFSEHPEPACCGHAKNPAAWEVLENRKSFLNGFLENIFMVRSSNLSEEINWAEFVCPQCLSLLGAYPCSQGYASVDGGLRLFKCYISTCLPIGGSKDIFREYTLERMFANQLLENANDELSFRTVIKDLKTRSPKVQVVLANLGSWSCTGDCSAGEDNEELVSKTVLHPVIRVLFSDCSSAPDSQLRMLEKRIIKNLADEVFMPTRQIEELAQFLKSAKEIYPPSCASLQGLYLSSIRR